MAEWPWLGLGFVLLVGSLVPFLVFPLAIGLILDIISRSLHAYTFWQIQKEPGAGQKLPSVELYYFDDWRGQQAWF